MHEMGTVHETLANAARRQVSSETTVVGSRGVPARVVYDSGEKTKADTLCSAHV